MAITFHATVTGTGSSLSVVDPEGRICHVNGPAGEYARTVELTPDVLAMRLSKTGGTPYVCVDAQCRIEPGLTLAASAINAMRREVLNQLTALRARRDDIRLNRPQRIPRYAGNQDQPELTVQVTTREQITEKLLSMKPSLLYVPMHLLVQDMTWTQALCAKAKVCVVLPRIVHDGEMAKIKDNLTLLRPLGIRDALIGNLGLLFPVRECGFRARGDWGLNLYNSGAVNAAREMELRSACLSFEMTLPQIRDVSKAVPCELLVYGRTPLMITENCLIKGRTGECTCHLAPAKLIDKTGAEFPIIKDGDSCRSVLLNGKKLNWLDRQDDLSRLGLWATRLYFTTENPKEVNQILNNYQHPVAFDPGACTRGLYLRGVE